jgi:predicted AAA+ superfamily ATPase
VVWRAEDPRDALRAYAQMYIREEIQAEALVRGLPGFVRMLPIAAIFHGQVVNVSAIARDAGVARNTVVGYLEILRDTLVTFELPAFEARLRVRERRHPKLYWVDAGLPRALRRQLGAVTMEERGALFEGWIAAVLRAYGDYRELFDDWAYWATGAGVEVDFLLRRADAAVAIEAKSATRVDRRDLGGLLAIGDLPGIVRRIVVYRGTTRQRTPEGIEIMPVRDWLDELAHGRLFTA